MVLASINEIVGEVLTLIADEARHHGIVVATDFKPHLPKIVIDRVQIQQVLINLVRNAIEAMDGIMDRPKEIVLISCRDAVDIRVEVRDKAGASPIQSQFSTPSSRQKRTEWEWAWRYVVQSLKRMAGAFGQLRTKVMAPFSVLPFPSLRSRRHEAEGASGLSCG